MDQNNLYLTIKVRIKTTSEGVKPPFHGVKQQVVACTPLLYLFPFRHTDLEAIKNTSLLYDKYTCIFSHLLIFL
jgi:hypothetical protein